jgi:hypothetical protein
MNLRHTRFLLVIGLLLVSIPLIAAGDAPNSAWRTWTPSTFAFTRFDGEFLGGRIYFLGGRLADASTDGSIWYYTFGAPGSYTDTGVDLPVAISNYTIASLRDAQGAGLYVFGGRDNVGNVITDIQAYYPATNQAVLINTDPYPGTCNGVTTIPGEVAVVANKAYVFGGFTNIGSCVSGETWIYNPIAPAGSRWTAGPALATPRGYIAGAVLQSRYILAVGGDDWDGAALIPLPNVELLDTTNLGAGWVARASLPPASSGIAGCDETRAFTVGGKVYLAGCGQWPNEVADSFVYTVTTNSWAPYNALLNARRNHAGAAVRVGSRQVFYIVGGRQTTDTNVLTISEINIPPASEAAEE